MEALQQCAFEKNMITFIFSLQWVSYNQHESVINAFFAKENKLNIYQHKAKLGI